MVNLRKPWEEKVERIVITCSSETKLKFIKFKMDERLKNNEDALLRLLAGYTKPVFS
jgi:tyrosine-protein phosphatase YwqE